MLKPSPPWQIFGCLLSVIGSIAGVAAGIWDFSRYVAAERAANPDAYISGTPIIAAIGLGGFFGAFFGLIVGVIVALPTTPRKP